MIAQAQVLDAQANVSVRYVNASAEKTGLSAHQADIVTAGQCWSWLNHPQALDEVQRLLKADGKLVIAHFDWLPLTGNMVAATEMLIQQYNPDWRLGGGLGLYPQWLPELSQAGFCNIETFSYDIDVTYTPEAWRGRIRASAGITALEAGTVRDFDTDLATMLATQYPSTFLLVPHRVFAIVSEVFRTL